MEIQKLDKYIITSETIDRLWTKVNTGRKFYVDTESPDLLFEIINLFFEDKGIDFWHMPEIHKTTWYPERREIEFTCAWDKE